MGEVVEFPRREEIIWDGTGPPFGVEAWQCQCGSFALYMTRDRMHCWDCHDEQVIE